MNIVVLAGGYSPERNVSLCSGALITKALRSLGHQTALVDLFLGEADPYTMQDLFERPVPEEWDTISVVRPDLDALAAGPRSESNALIGPHVLEICRQADLVFLALHGGSGEDGRMQAVLDMLGIPYTGSGYLGSAIAMNKDLCKELALRAGVDTPDYRRVVIENQQMAEELIAQTEIPVVIKVPDSGSSVGVYIVHTAEELRQACCANIGHAVLIEQFIEGREIQMAFLGDRPLPSIEIVPLSGFYDYDNKYRKGASIETSPADIPAEAEKKMGAMLMAVAHAARLSDYARADFIIDRNGKIWFIEINTLPGMTPTSLVPQEAAAVGISYPSLCEEIIRMASSRPVGLAKEAGKR